MLTRGSRRSVLGAGLALGAGLLAGNSPYNGLDLTGGVRFGFYSLEADGMRFATPAQSGNDYAAELIQAALARRPLRHF